LLLPVNHWASHRRAHPDRGAEEWDVGGHGWPFSLAALLSRLDEAREELEQYNRLRPGETVASFRRVSPVPLISVDEPALSAAVRAPEGRFAQRRHAGAGALGSRPASSAGLRARSRCAGARQ
jgi:hypothetical protein